MLGPSESLMGRHRARRASQAQHSCAFSGSVALGVESLPKVISVNMSSICGIFLSLFTLRHSSNGSAMQCSPKESATDETRAGRVTSLVLLCPRLYNLSLANPRY